MASGDLNRELKKKVVGLRLWELIGICVGAFIGLILCILSMWVTCRRRSKRTHHKYTDPQIPFTPKDIRVDRVGDRNMNDHPENVVVTVPDKSSDKNSEKLLVHLGMSKSSDADNISQCSSMYYHERPCSSHSGEEGSSAENVIGEGGYGVVYRGVLINGTEVAVKKLLNNLGQAEREFRVEVEAIGHVWHKNLVRLLGYFVEGVHRILVYEYMNNRNLEQWLHGAMRQHGSLTWEARMKVLLGTAKALAYLHEAIEPKLLDFGESHITTRVNSKVSDFGLAKLLDSGESHITTRVMGTFGYVAPEYANTGLLNEKSDIYSFGVLLLEAITGRDPVDYSRPANEVNLVEWLKTMVGNRRAEETHRNIAVKKLLNNITVLSGSRKIGDSASTKP
ncbi:Protein kinase domain-containing protein [Heracleum sosnowskyi]|uniref:non-specific serine/threonine protein kinase n=1 Tax=Heracleum sosnowskyi TaxID=360622 RepID=A0AAD8NE10_9APIA|nr:Protein kinase domain-containing protein [Heracleum sosnowskyi]